MTPFVRSHHRESSASGEEERERKEGKAREEKLRLSHLPVESPRLGLPLDYTGNPAPHGTMK